MAPRENKNNAYAKFWGKNRVLWYFPEWPINTLGYRYILLCMCVRRCNIRKCYNPQTSDVFRLGGPDPLDFISMFNNLGSPMDGIPSHWHYISAGLSDLHGDGRVHG